MCRESFARTLAATCHYLAHYGMIMEFSMRRWSRQIISSIVALVAVPIGVELLISYIKHESYSTTRTGIVLGGVGVAILLFTLIGYLSKSALLVIEISLALLGLTIAIASTFSVSSTPSGGNLNIAILTLCMGVMVCLIGSYAIYIDVTGADMLFATPKESGAHAIQDLDEGGYRTRVTKLPSFAPIDEEVVGLCRNAVSPNDLNFVGYFVNGSCRFYLDALDNDTLNRFFRNFSRDDRRRAYEHAGRQLAWTVQRLNTYLRRLQGGILIRTVLDVEQGALYYCWLDKDVYLIGVTMDQSRVLIADEKLRLLANSIGLLPRGGAYGYLPQSSTQQVIAPD